MTMNTLSNLRSLHCGNIDRAVRPPIEVVLVDFGGVLCNFKETPEINILAERHPRLRGGLAALLFENEASYAGILGRISADEVLGQIGKELGLSEQAMQEIWTAFLAANVADQSLLEALDRVRERKKIVVLSNYWSNGREVIFSKVPETAFDGLYLSAELGIRKPQNAMWDYLIRTFSVPPYMIALLDDDAANVRAAWEAGLDAYLWIGR
ncbi:HAD superfamily hydrolase (TIGR01509 family) [Bradyrhizobium japonicum]